MPNDENTNYMSMPPPGNATGPEDTANLALNQMLQSGNSNDNDADDGGGGEGNGGASQAANYFPSAGNNGGGGNNGNELGGGGGDDGGSDNGLMDSAWIVKLRGLPWSVTAQDIMDFLGDVEVSGGSNGVHLITYSRNSSRPNGEAFVVCATEDSYNKAFQYNKQSMGHRYIESE